MINAYDIAYGLCVGISAPYWLLKPSARRKVFRAFSERMGDCPARNAVKPAVMIHAVSLGEMNATRGLVERIAALRPDLQFIITTTTQTGYQRGRELYGPDPNVLLVHYPLDFSRGVKRFLENIQPDVVVLMELEVWPNFLRECQRREIPVLLINGRVTSSSYRNYRFARPLIRRMFKRLAAICVQDELYARRFVQLGAIPERVSVTGTMKFDTATIADRVPGDADLGAAVGLYPGVERVWVCGSTGPGEEELILACYRSLMTRHIRLRLVLVPRKPERFDEVAALIRAAGFEVIRRSHTVNAPRDNRAPTLRALDNAVMPPVVLGDTMGELRKFYSLADVVFSGRSLVDLGSRQHGSDMIEPAALGRATIVGPYTANFAAAVARLEEAEGVMVIRDADDLVQAVSVLISTPDQAIAMGRRAQAVIQDQRGATEKHVEVILQYFREHQQQQWPLILKYSEGTT